MMATGKGRTGEGHRANESHFEALQNDAKAWSVFAYLYVRPVVRERLRGQSGEEGHRRTTSGATIMPPFSSTSWCFLT